MTFDQRRDKEVRAHGQRTVWSPSLSYLCTVPLSVYFDFFGGTKNTFMSFSKFKMAVTYKKNPKYPPKWLIIWPKYSYDIIHHQFTFALAMRSGSCISTPLLKYHRDAQNSNKIFCNPAHRNLKAYHWLLVKVSREAETQMGLSIAARGNTI